MGLWRCRALQSHQHQTHKAACIVVRLGCNQLINPASGHWDQEQRFLLGHYTPTLQHLVAGMVTWACSAPCAPVI